MRATMFAGMLVAAIVLAAAPAFAQDIPRTPDGKPDFHGYWFSGFMTQMQRPKGVTDLIVKPENRDGLIAKLKEDTSEGEVYDPEFDTNAVPPALLEMNGEFRSSLLVEPADGRLPLTSLAKAAINGGEEGFDNPEDRPSPERCMDGLVNAPLAGSALLIPLQMVQTRDALVLAAEDMEPLRIVALGGAPRPTAPRTRGGQSRGDWTGDTLIVETDGFAINNSQGVIWTGGAFLTADSKVIERFTLISADALLYQFTIEDPSVYTRPWRAEFVFKRIPRPVYEYACHEGNHALIHILTAARLGKQEAPAAP